MPFKGYELRACLLNVGIYGTAYKMNSTELKLEVCHQKSYASWHDVFTFQNISEGSFGTCYWLFSSASSLNLFNFPVCRSVTSKSIGVMVAL